MKATIKKGVLSIDVREMLDALGPEERRDVARALVADDALFAAVLECVADDTRFGHYHQDDPDGAWWFGAERVLELRAQLLPLMPQIARRAVEQALAERNEANAEAERYRAWAASLYHAWPSASWHLRPRGPEDWKPAPMPTEEDVEQRLAVDDEGAG